MRNRIRFESLFILKPRDAAVAHERAVALLTAFTSFTAWRELTLRVRLPRGKAATMLVGAPATAAQTFDRDALVAHGLELDAIAIEALGQFGPARFTSRESSSAGPWCALTWQVDDSLPPAGWLAFCVAHAGATVDDFAGVELAFDAGTLALIDPATRAPLPFQAGTHYPPWKIGETYARDCGANAWLWLPRRALSLQLRLPFESADAAFRDYIAHLDGALGQPLSRKHWHAVLSNKAGTGEYERTLIW